MLQYLKLLYNFAPQHILYRLIVYFLNSNLAAGIKFLHIFQYILIASGFMFSSLLLYLISKGKGMVLRSWQKFGVWWSWTYWSDLIINCQFEKTVSMYGIKYFRWDYSSRSTRKILEHFCKINILIYIVWVKSPLKGDLLLVNANSQRRETKNFSQWLLPHIGYWQVMPEIM